MHYLFDFDGTLADSMPTWAGFHISMLKEYGIPCPSDFINTIVPIGSLRASQYAIDLGVKLTLEEYHSKMKTVLAEYYDNSILLKSGAVETLKRLIANGHQVHILTASPHRFVDPCLTRNGAYDLFGKIWSSDEFDYTKNDERIYIEAAKRLGADISDCIFVDDNVTCIETARRAGMFTVGIYDETSSAFFDGMKKAADRYVYQFDEIMDIEF